MIVPQEIKDMCQAEIDRCTAIAKRNYPNVVLPTPTLSYDQRGRVAGTYHYVGHRIKINAVLLMENVDEMVENTVSHEYAHLVDRAVHGQQFRWKGHRRVRISHGATFKQIMREFGRSESTTHNMDTTNATVKRKTGVKHIWKCGCGNGVMELGAKRHAKQLRANGFRSYYMRGHAPSRCGAYKYYGIKGQELPEMQIDMAAKNAKSKVKPASKLDRCRALYNSTVSRMDNIDMFVQQAQCTIQGAATYYAKIKKEATK